MNILEKWFFKRIIAKEVVQSSRHESNIINMYAMIKDACRKEFYEDNDATLNQFLLDCFNNANKTFKK